MGWHGHIRAGHRAPRAPPPLSDHARPRTQRFQAWRGRWTAARASPATRGVACAHCLASRHARWARAVRGLDRRATTWRCPSSVTANKINWIAPATRIVLANGKPACSRNDLGFPNLRLYTGVFGDGGSDVRSAVRFIRQDLLGLFLIGMSLIWGSDVADRPVCCRIPHITPRLAKSIKFRQSLPLFGSEATLVAMLLVHIWQSRNPSILLPLFHRRRCPTGPPAQLHSVLRGSTFPRIAAAAHKAFHDYRRVVASVRRATDTAGPFASKHTNKCDLLRILQENCNGFLEHVSIPQVH